jgi:hypothetical protein
MNVHNLVPYCRSSKPADVYLMVKAYSITRVDITDIPCIPVNDMDSYTSSICPHVMNSNKERPCAGHCAIGDDMYLLYPYGMLQSGQTEVGTEYDAAKYFFMNYERSGLGDVPYKHYLAAINETCEGNRGCVYKRSLSAVTGSGIRSVIAPVPFSMPNNVYIPRLMFDNMTFTASHSKDYCDTRTYQQRKLRPGDYVLINRQPVLGKSSSQIAKVYPSDRTAILLPTDNCSEFNADFDGDEMSIHMFGTSGSIREADMYRMTSRPEMSYEEANTYIDVFPDEDYDSAEFKHYMDRSRDDLVLMSTTTDLCSVIKCIDATYSARTPMCKVRPLELRKELRNGNEKTWNASPLTLDELMRGNQNCQMIIKAAVNKGPVGAQSNRAMMLATMVTMREPCKLELELSYGITYSECMLTDYEPGLPATRALSILSGKLMQNALDASKHFSPNSYQKQPVAPLSQLFSRYTGPSVSLHYSNVGRYLCTLRTYKLPNSLHVMYVEHLLVPLKTLVGTMDPRVLHRLHSDETVDDCQIMSIVREGVKMMYQMNSLHSPDCDMEGLTLLIYAFSKYSGYGICDKRSWIMFPMTAMLQSAMTGFARMEEHEIDRKYRIGDYITSCMFSNYTNMPSISDTVLSD